MTNPMRAADRWLLGIVDAALAGIIFVAPYLFGGRHPIGELVVVALAVLAAAAWGLRAALRGGVRWRNSPAYWLILAAIVLVSVQLAPLSPQTLSLVAGQNEQLLPLWTAGDGPHADSLGTWSRISLVPPETRGGLVLLVAYGLLFIVVVQRVETAADAERLLTWIGLSAAAMAVFGLIQYLAANGKFLWFYEHPYRQATRVQGPFFNRNHFAHLIALGLGPLVWWVTVGAVGRRSGGTATSTGGRSERQAAAGRSLGTQGASRSTGAHIGRRAAGSRRHGADYIVFLRLLVLSVAIFAGLLSLSRGGALVILLAGSLCGLAYYYRGLLGARAMVGVAALAVLVGLSLAVHGYPKLAGRLADFTTGSIDDLDKDGGRRSIYTASLAAIRQAPLAGTGVGSFREVYPLHYPHPERDSEFTHAESGYLQVAVETGVVGLLLLLLGIGMCGYWCVATVVRSGSVRLAAAAGAVAASLAASAVHSAFDFPWYLSALMAITVILAACGQRIWQMAQSYAGTAADAPRGRTLPGWACVGACGLVFLAGAWMVGDRLGPALASVAWDDYERIAARHERGRVDPNDPEQHRHIAPLAAALEHVLHHDPHHARAHLRLADLYLRRFEQLQTAAASRDGASPGNEMPLAMIRDAALASQAKWHEQAVDAVARLDRSGDGRLSRAEIAADPQLAALLPTDAASQTDLAAEPLARGLLRGWLSRAVGDHYRHLYGALHHARRGLELSPLAGEGYLHLASLGFLQHAPESAKSALIDQALRVRPHDGTVLFEAGREAALRFDADGLKYWRACFHSGPYYQRQLALLLVGRLPDVSYVLENFNPDLEGLKVWRERHRELVAAARQNLTAAAATADPRTVADSPAADSPAIDWLEDQIRKLDAAIAPLAEAQALAHRDGQAVACWIEAFTAWRNVENHEAALAAIESAIRAAPNNYRARRAAGLYLAERGRHSAAVAHLKWCADQQPDDRAVEEALRKAVRVASVR